MGSILTAPPPLYDTVPDSLQVIIRNCMAHHQHPAPFLPNYGVNYPLEHEKLLDYHAKTMTIEQLAKYADLVCLVMCDDQAFIDDSLNSFSSTLVHEHMNMTTLGNLACLILHSGKSSETFKPKIQEFRDFILEYQRRM